MTHGTLQGYRAHRTDGTTPCDPCRRAYEKLYGPDAPRADGQPVPAWTFDPEADKRAHYPTPRTPARDLWHRPPQRPTVLREECGTVTGHTKHLRMREVPCVGCARAVARPGE